MCTLEAALKKGNIELAQAEDHQVLDNISHDVVSDFIIEEVLNHKSHANVAGNAEIVIAGREKEAFTGQINDKNVQAQWYGCSVPNNSYSNTSESYFPYILHESLLRVQEFKQMQQEFQVNQVVGSYVESSLPSLFFEKNTLHPMLAWLSMLEKLLRLEFHHMCKEA